MSLVNNLLLGLMATVTVVLTYFLIKVVKNDSSIGDAFKDKQSLKKMSNVQEKSDSEHPPHPKPRKEEEEPPQVE